MTSRASRLIVLALVGVVGGSLAALSQTTIPIGPNERHVKPEANVQDGDSARNARLWVLDFKFKDPRIIKVNIPGRGQRVVWYMWYQVINNTGQPRTFIPDFELRTHDTNMTYQDQIMPAAQAAITRLEDPTGFYKIKNSVTISADPIPISLPKAMARPVTGVAIWVDPNEPGPDDDQETRKKKAKLPRLAQSNHYSVFVAGLSNGWAETQAIGDDKEKVIRRKTLQLSFKRLGDEFRMRSEEIRFHKHEWIYRGSKLKIALPSLSKDKDKKDEK